MTRGGALYAYREFLTDSLLFLRRLQFMRSNTYCGIPYSTLGRKLVVSRDVRSVVQVEWESCETYLRQRSFLNSSMH